MKIFKSKPVLLAAISAIAALSIVALRYEKLLPVAGPNDITPPSIDSRERIDGDAQGSYLIDYNNNRKLVGDSHNIFVARIIRRSGNIKSAPHYPENQLEAEVIYNIKGNLEGIVTVNQWGNFLEPGTTYLLAARQSRANGWYTVDSLSVFWKIISENPNLTKEQLLELAKNDSRVRDLMVAYPDEILSDADLYHNNARNSFQSLSEEEKQAVYDKIEELEALQASGVTASVESSKPAPAAPPPTFAPPPPQISPEEARANDLRRAADLQEARNALTLYFNKCGYYPGPELTTGESCPPFSPAPDYATMRDAVLRSGLGVTEMPENDPKGKSYGYDVSNDGLHYVVSALLDDPQSDLLKDDIDGATFSGFPCGSTSLPETPPIYCVGL